MKKYLLSAFIIFTFGVYTLQEKMTGAKNLVLKTPLISTVQPASISTAPITTIQSPTQSQQNSSGYKDGAFTGGSEDAFYGNVQVEAVIQNGKIVDVQFLDYPQDRDTSVEINTAAMPILKSETIQAQNAKVDVVSGATQTSLAYVKSLQNALTQAKN